MSRARAYWDQRLGESWNLQGAGVRSLSHAYNAWQYRLKRRAFRRAIRRLRSDWRSTSVLDAGVGTGFFLRQWLEAGVGVAWGLDVSPEAIRRLRAEHPGCEFVCADLAGDLETVPREAFDAVSVFDTMVHLVDDEGCRATLANLASLLRPGGYLLLSENFLHHGERRFADYWCSRPLAFYERALADVNLEIVERRPVFFLMNSPVDTADPRIAEAWQRTVRPAHREWLGFLLGAILYPCDLALTALLRESPTTELMVCRKRPAPPRSPGPPVR